MRFLELCGIAVLVSLRAMAAASPGAELWEGLKQKRASLPGVHQEFRISQESRTTKSTQASKRELVIDMAGARWRERSITGSGEFIKISDGENVFSMEEGGNEFVREKHHTNNEDPAPDPYNLEGVDWSKAVKREERGCGFTSHDHKCVLIEVPIKPWTKATRGSGFTRLNRGTTVLLVDTETGLLVSRRTLEFRETPQLAWQYDVSYILTRMQTGPVADARAFQVPSDDMKEVKELSRWNVAKIRKLLAGKAAPELNLVDISGKPISLSAFKGKTVLLDFWTTWCPPCRADAPSLDKLYAKYSSQNLMIVGISVSEDRTIVEAFLKEHPHNFPVVLTTENEMPHAYQIGEFPTYIVIDSDGTLSAAVEGDQGLAKLRKLLKKAGLEVD
jgi:thiol-disulfide isomerase/thioredoxin